MSPLNLFRDMFSFEALLMILVVLGILLLIREVLTWYWKLNKISDLLEKIEENTRK